MNAGRVGVNFTDQKWDSIRRVIYSTPGRWVQILDLNQLAFMDHAQVVLIDFPLTRLFQLTPFLSVLSL